MSPPISGYHLTHQTLAEVCVRANAVIPSRRTQVNVDFGSPRPISSLVIPATASNAAPCSLLWHSSSSRPSKHLTLFFSQGKLAWTVRRARALLRAAFTQPRGPLSQNFQASVLKDIPEKGDTPSHRPSRHPLAPGTVPPSSTPAGPRSD